MMDLLLATSGGEAQAAGGGYVDDVFSAYTYVGNGNDEQQIINNIDLAGKGGMVWIKNRTSTVEHILTSTGLEAAGGLWNLRTNETVAAYRNTWAGGLLMNSNGFTAKKESSASISTNGINSNYISWTFRKAPKFFDVVTYTGNGASNRALSHQLNADVGMVMVKATSTTGDWWVFHRGATGDLVLNSTAAQTASKANIPSATSSTFTVNGSANTNGVQYVAYLFAHDPSAEGIIQCGSYAGSSGVQPVNLGWEPQYLLIKSSTATNNWTVFDTARGIATGGNDPTLHPNASSAENGQTGAGDWLDVTATGFNAIGSEVNLSGRTYIYLAIRRPNKPPTTGTQVYNAIARTGTGAAATVTGVGFAPDLAITKKRSSTTLTGARFVDRLRGATRWLDSSADTAETVTADTVTGLDNMDGFVLGADATTSAFNTNTHTYINHFFRRAKWFFDVVCDTGTGSTHGITHGLSVAPEFVIRKSSSGATQWECWHSALAATEKLVLNSTAAKATDTAAWNSTLPTPTQFTVGTGANVNTNAATYVTYLFATLAGISKVGSYTGNGTSQTINCGFSTGSRFILVKRTDATGDWYVWDSVRGIIAANDPHLSLNTTAAEVTTDDSVDPEASGFIVNQNTATNINVSGGQYIFLAIA